MVKHCFKILLFIDDTFITYVLTNHLRLNYDVSCLLDQLFCLHYHVNKTDFVFASEFLV